MEKLCKDTVWEEPKAVILDWRHTETHKNYI